MQLLLTGADAEVPHAALRVDGTPNIHMSTILDFEEFLPRRGIRVVRRGYVARGRYAPRMRWPNLFSEGCVALIEKAV